MVISLNSMNRLAARLTQDAQLISSSTSADNRNSNRPRKERYNAHKTQISVRSLRLSTFFGAKDGSNRRNFRNSVGRNCGNNLASSSPLKIVNNNLDAPREARLKSPKTNGAKDGKTPYRSARNSLKSSRTRSASSSESREKAVNLGSESDSRFESIPTPFRQSSLLTPTLRHRSKITRESVLSSLANT